MSNVTGKTAEATDAVLYELMVIVSPEIGETAIKKRLESLKKTLTDFGGEITFEDDWGVRELAYSIRKQDQGHYFVMDVNLDSKHIKELDRILRLEVEVLRHLLMKLPAAYQPKTMAAMEAEHAVEAAKNAELKAEKEQKMARPMIRKHPEPVKMAEPVKAAAPTKTTEEEAPKKTTKVVKKEELEDIDAKLDSILSNPDINF